jgi:hypothetical protein
LNGYDDTCWAKPETLIVTHWFTDSCVNGAVWYTAGNTKVCHDHSGSYYNYDWFIDSWRTDVYQWTQICGRNDGYFDYWWNHTDSGDSAGTIFGVLMLNT